MKILQNSSFPKNRSGIPDLFFGLGLFKDFSGEYR